MLYELSGICSLYQILNITIAYFNDYKNKKRGNNLKIDEIKPMSDYESDYESEEETLDFPDKIVEFTGVHTAQEETDYEDCGTLKYLHFKTL